MKHEEKVLLDGLAEDVEAIKDDFKKFLRDERDDIMLLYEMNFDLMHIEDILYDRPDDVREAFYEKTAMRDLLSSIRTLISFIFMNNQRAEKGLDRWPLYPLSYEYMLIDWRF